MNNYYYIRKGEKFKTNELNILLKMVENNSTLNLKKLKGEKITIRIIIRINENKYIHNTKKAKAWLLVKANKIDKFPTRLIKKKMESTNNRYQDGKRIIAT